MNGLLAMVLYALTATKSGASNYVVSASDVQVELRSMTPPKTPVCFASMFTGAPPEVHGIRKYERPVLTCDTLFDALARAGKRAAIVAVRDCSMDIIFRSRPIDYFTEDYDPQVTERALELVRDGNHDFIVAYNQEYDDTLHRTRHVAHGFGDLLASAAVGNQDGGRIGPVGAVKHDGV